VQLGDGDEPKRSSLPKGWTPDSLSLERALQLLKLPREIGLHPETGKPITAGLGRYGPFVLHEGTYANLPDVEEVFTVGLNRAVDLLAEKAAGGGRFGRGNRAAPAAIKTFEHEAGPISVRAGRYGPYVNQGKVNATLPKTLQPEDVTLEQALELIVAKGGATPKKKTASRSATAKKPAAKKAATKTTATKAKATAKPKAASKPKAENPA
jgi:DNA topoisomerase-1